MLEDTGLSVPPPAGESATAATPLVAASRTARLEQFTLADLAGIRNLLRGGSVIDWHRLYFRDRAEVDRFLRVNEFDPESPEDMARLAALREQAVE